MTPVATHRPDPIPLAAYVLDLLEDDRRKELESHLTACTACAALVEGIRMITLKTSVSRHASPAELAEWVRATPARRAATMTDVAQHLCECAPCAREVEIINDAVSHASDEAPTSADTTVLKGSIAVSDGGVATIAEFLRALVAPVLAQGGVVWGIPATVRGGAATAHRAHAIDSDMPAADLAEIAILEIRSTHGESVRIEKTPDGASLRLSSPRFATGAPAAGMRVYAHVGEHRQEITSSLGGETVLTLAAMRELSEMGGILEVVLTPAWTN